MHRYRSKKINRYINRQYRWNVKMMLDAWDEKTIHLITWIPKMGLKKRTLAFSILTQQLITLAPFFSTIKPGPPHPVRHNFNWRAYSCVSCPRHCKTAQTVAWSKTLKQNIVQLSDYFPVYWSTVNSMWKNRRQSI